jgi:uncharacterized protein (DUF427 family)
MGISDHLPQGVVYCSYSVESEGLTIKRARAPKIGTQITISTQIAFEVEDKVIFFILIREINDKTIQETSRRILTICKMTGLAKFWIIIILSFLTCKTYLD